MAVLRVNKISLRPGLLSNSDSLKFKETLKLIFTPLGDSYGKRTI